MIPPKRFIETCRKYQVPMIVDDASGMHMREMIAAGADLVTFSCQKWLRGPTVGLIAADVTWCTPAFCRTMVSGGR